MKIVQTTMTPLAVTVTFANNSEPQLATERVEMSFPIAALTVLLPTDRSRLLGPGDLAGQFVGEVQAAALLYARDQISGEIQRIREAARQR